MEAVLCPCLLIGKKNQNPRMALGAHLGVLPPDPRPPLAPRASDSQLPPSDLALPSALRSLNPTKRSLPRRHLTSKHGEREGTAARRLSRQPQYHPRSRLEGGEGVAASWPSRAASPPSDGQARGRRARTRGDHAVQPHTLSNGHVALRRPERPVLSPRERERRRRRRRERKGVREETLGLGYIELLTGFLSLVWAVVF